MRFSYLSLIWNSSTSEEKSILLATGVSVAHKTDSGPHGTKKEEELKVKLIMGMVLNRFRFGGGSDDLPQKRV